MSREHVWTEWDGLDRSFRSECKNCGIFAFSRSVTQFCPATKTGEENKNMKQSDQPKGYASYAFTLENTQIQISKFDDKHIKLTPTDRAPIIIPVAALSLMCECMGYKPKVEGF